VPLPERRRLHHTPPGWVKSGARYFITICAADRGKDVLTIPAVAVALIRNAIHYHRLGRWWLDVFLLMPDHLHALLSVPHGVSLQAVVPRWKGYQTKDVGVTWQSGFFDHRLRSDESADEKLHYILNNPVRARLVARAEDWPHAWVQWRDDLTEDTPRI
jgi:REP element-mobilizing transposase RayT